MNKRRKLIIAVGAGALVAPVDAFAQHRGDRVRRVGVLIPLNADDPARQSMVAALRQSLKELGWDAATIRIDERGSADPNLTRGFARELVGLNPDVIVVNGPTATAAAREESHEVPIVFAAISDPVRLGFVDSLARPGGNVTGFMLLEYSVVSKLLESVKEIAPSVKRAALLFNPENLAWSGHWGALETAARSLGVQPIAVPIRSPDDIEPAITTFAREPNGALLAAPDTVVWTHRKLIVALAARHRLPAAYGSLEMVDIGGLMSYGPNVIDNYHRAASYVDRILKGAKPADLPVQLPNKYYLRLNLKTARALGLTIPQSLLVRVDETIG